MELPRMWFILGVLAGGAAMYYIQPVIKDRVAKAFGWEQSVYDNLQARAAALRASNDNKNA
jgi:hypothetical protein